MFSLFECALDSHLLFAHVCSRTIRDENIIGKNYRAENVDGSLQLCIWENKRLCLGLARLGIEIEYNFEEYCE